MHTTYGNWCHDVIGYDSKGNKIETEAPYSHILIDDCLINVILYYIYRHMRAHTFDLFLVSFCL